jgi:hypothetical protein
MPARCGGAPPAGVLRILQRGAEALRKGCAEVLQGGHVVFMVGTSP